MSLDPSSALPDRQRIRLRFRKEGDLRWISHRDLVRTVERLLRRAGLVLRMSEGFHPKPKMMFPSALALGIEGQAEVLELELVRPADPRALETRLNAQAPPGLVVSRVQVLDPGQGKARVRTMTYQFPVSQQRRPQVEQAIEQLLADSSLWVRRDDRPEPVNMRADLESLEWCDGVVRFRIRATQQASLRPRDVLQALGLAELEQQGAFLTRSEVELTS
ncbi:MAG: TIGR03936 family radical SAM-associated protein [Pirellulaceae bacterium]